MSALSIYRVGHKLFSLNPTTSQWFRREKIFILFLFKHNNLNEKGTKSCNACLSFVKRIHSLALMRVIVVLTCFVEKYVLDFLLRHLALWTFLAVFLLVPFCSATNVFSTKPNSPKTLREFCWRSRSRAFVALLTNNSWSIHFHSFSPNNLPAIFLLSTEAFGYILGDMNEGFNISYKYLGALNKHHFVNYRKPADHAIDKLN